MHILNHEQCKIVIGYFPYFLLNNYRVYVDDNYTADYLRLECVDSGGGCDTIDINCEGDKGIEQERMNDDVNGSYSCYYGEANYCCPLIPTSPPTTDPTTSAPTTSPTDCSDSITINIPTYTSDDISMFNGVVVSLSVHSY